MEQGQELGVAAKLILDLKLELESVYLLFFSFSSSSKT